MFVDARSLPDLKRFRRLNRRGEVCGGRATVFRLDLCLFFWQHMLVFVINFYFFLGVGLILLV